MKRAFIVAAAAAALAGFGSLQAQAGEPVWDANKVQLQPQQLGQGVYAMVPAGAEASLPKGVPLATTSGIVVGERATLVIDTMLNKRLAGMVLAEARKLGKGAAPAYAVNTSYHGDHSFGNMYLPKSTVVIQHEATQAYVGEHFKKDVEFMIGAFGQGRGIEQIVPRTGDVLVPKGGSLRLDLGGRAVEIRDFGFAQTGGDLWVWVPDAKVLFAGNPVIAEQPAIPWLLDGHVQDTLDTLVKVRDFLPPGARIVPGHGRPMTRESLDWHIGYLTALRDETKAAIAAGATLQDLPGRVTLPAYQGYAIYDWVHKQVNLGAAYNEFKR